MSAARKHAQAADNAVMRGEVLGPLHGIPITMEDSIDVVGFASTWGVRDLKDNRPAKGAPVVDMLTSAGAIVSGKTNVPWFALSWETFNDLHITTENPWNVPRAPGSSSGGSAAAPTAGLSFCSDAPAFLRNPAH